MKTIIYCMNVDINWIKQRPHFLAEGLTKKYDLEVYYPLFYNRKVLTKNSFEKEIVSHKIYRLPNAIDCNWLKKVSDAIINKYMSRKIMVKKPDVLFLCSPIQAGYIPHNYKGLAIYDCMDDLVALASSENEKKRVYSNEYEMISKCDCILVTSDELRNVINKRYKDILKNKNVVLCRNAFNGTIVDVKDSTTNSDLPFKIGYFGTVSTWFDFKSLEYCLSKLNNIEFHIAGPIVDGVKIPDNNRIKYHGLIKHEKLIEFVNEMNCLTMPFEVNEITKSVDPVKFYEYINFNKNIVSVYYDEIERFSPFVNFYNNEEELFLIIKGLMENNKLKYSYEDRIAFLKNNCWDSRCKQIEQVIEETNV